MELLLMVMAFIALDIAALRWGSNSREAWNSAAWERRGNGRALHCMSQQQPVAQTWFSL